MAGIEHGFQPSFMDGVPKPQFAHLDRPRADSGIEGDEPAPDKPSEIGRMLGGIGAVGEFPEYGSKLPIVSRHEELDVEPEDSGWAD